MVRFFRDILDVLVRLSGLFLAMAALWLGYCAEELRKIRLEVECLHEDIDKHIGAHDRAAMEREYNG